MSVLATSKLKLPTARREQKAPPETLVLGGVFGILLFGPLAFGAVESWARFIMEAGSALLFSYWMYKQLQSGETKVRGNPLFKPMLAFGAIVLIQLLFRLTAYWHETLSKAMVYLAYALLAFLACQGLRRSSQVKVLAVVISGYGSGLACFAMLQGLSSTTKIYWLRSVGASWIYGPYVNHNHYAGLMEMLVPVPLVMCLTRFAHRWVRSAGVAAASIMAVTIFLSGSRGGMLALAVEGILFGTVLIQMQRGPRVAAGIGMFLVIVIGLVVWIGGGEVAKRLASVRSEARAEVAGGTRWSLNKDSLRMAEGKPLLGWGLGCFPVVYPQYRSFYTNFFVNQAHDDYLQLLVETGLAGFATMLWFLWRLYRGALKKVENWATEIQGSVALAALLGCTGILVHSFVDFNLQVPANAAWFYVLAALAASQYPLEGRQRVRRHRHSTETDPIAETASGTTS